MSSSPPNRAAYLTGPAQPLQVRSAPYTAPGAGELVIKVGAVAINPVDWIIQKSTKMVMPWIKYPHIIGSDIAGTVHDTGPGVTRFTRGDRVLSHAAAMDEKHNQAAKGGFQEYCVGLSHMTAAIPGDIPFTHAAVIPLGASTAACALFQDDHLALHLPTSPPAAPTGKTVLVWGGATSVGCNAIQLAGAAGYDVLSTSSPRNFQLLRSLGAAQVFDYASQSVVADIVVALAGIKIAGAVAIGQGAADKCLDVLHRCQQRGDDRTGRVLAMVSYPAPATPSRYFPTLVMAWVYISGVVGIWVKSKVRGIRSGYVWGSSLMHNQVGPAVYNGFLGKGLEEGEYRPMPEAMVVGQGLEALEMAMGVQKGGVSARKVVVEL